MDSDQDFNLERILSCHWKVGFPPSIRLSNRVAIAEALQKLHQLRFQDLTALDEANTAECHLFDSSASDYNYLVGVDEHIKLINHYSQKYQGPDIRSPELASSSMSRQEDAIKPSAYFLTQPVSKKHMVLRIVDPGPHTLENMVIQDRGPFSQKSRKRGEVTPPAGPFQSLLARQNEIYGCVQSMLASFLSKLEAGRIPAVPLHKTIVSLVITPIQKSCEALSTTLDILKEEMNKITSQPADMNLKIMDIEEFYFSSVSQALQTFKETTDSSNRDLILERQKQLTGMGGPCQGGLFRDALPSSPPVGLTARMGQSLPQYFREGQQNEDLSNTPGELNAQRQQSRELQKSIELLPEKFGKPDLFHLRSLTDPSVSEEQAPQVAQEQNQSGQQTRQPAGSSQNLLPQDDGFNEYCNTLADL